MLKISSVSRRAVIPAFKRVATRPRTFRTSAIALTESNSFKPLPDGEYRPREEPRKQAIIDSMLRVDHAGEYGAVRIYEGQLMVISDPEMRKKITEMRDQELKHLEELNNLLPQRRARPTALLPLWGAAGYALGIGSALLGSRAAMACTVAVEESIVDHYNEQLRDLQEFKEEGQLRAMIKKNRDEEDEHRETGIKHEAEQMPLYSVFNQVIKAGCSAAIWAAKRL